MNGWNYLYINSHLFRYAVVTRNTIELLRMCVATITGQQFRRLLNTAQFVAFPWSHNSRVLHGPSAQHLSPGFGLQRHSRFHQSKRPVASSPVSLEQISVSPVSCYIIFSSKIRPVDIYNHFLFSFYSDQIQSFSRNLVAITGNNIIVSIAPPTSSVAV